MMKYVFILSASVTLGLTAATAHAVGPSAAPLGATEGSYEVAGLAWRCGKNNPAEWGTFGNGCLKQKRAAKKNGSASTGTGNFAVEQPAPPPPKLRLTN